MSDPTKAAISHADAKGDYFALAAFGMAWVLLAWRASPSGLWVGDYTSIKDLGAQAVGYEGIPSQLLAGCFRCLPVGSAVHRVSLVSAFGAAAIAWLTVHLSLPERWRAKPCTWSSCWLALGSTMLILQGTTVQQAATVASGATTAAALGLGSILLANRVVELHADATHLEDEADARNRATLLGGCVALTWLESHATGLLVTIISLLLPVARGRFWRKSSLLGLASGFAVTMALIGLPYYFARRGPAAVSLEQGLVCSLATRRLFSDVSTRFEPWLKDLGVLWFAVACGGLLSAIAGSGRRRSAWMALTIVAVLLVLPTQPAETGSRASLIIIGLAGFSAAIARGLRDATHFTSTRRPQVARLTTTIAVIVQTVAVLVRNDDANYSVNHYRSLGAEAFTDEVLATLPARALVMAKTPEVYRRLLAAQITEAMRPDVSVIALEQATDPRIVGSLIAAEPALAPVLRDLTIVGRPSENALSNLADSRPLFIEFDGHWDPRLRDHLLVLPFLHRAFSQTLGRSDRAAVLSAGQRAVSRLVALTGAEKSRGNALPSDRDMGDARTLEVVDWRVREQLTLLLALGDRQNFEVLIADYATQFGDSKWLQRLRQRIGSNAKGAVEAFDLLYREQTPRDTSMDAPRRRRG